MESYTSTAAVINLGVAPSIPTLRWSFDARVALSRRQCAKPVPAAVMERRRARFAAKGWKGRVSEHPGRGRRHRLETRTRQMLAFIQGAPVGRVEDQRCDLRGHTIGELLYAPIPDAPRWALALRMQGRALLDLVVRHGPASGWGVPQPTGGAAANPKWTPYYVPRKSERNWRWWRAAVVFLAKVLDQLAGAWWKLSPTHRTAPGGTTAAERGRVFLASPLVEPSGCRDQLPSEVGRVPLSLRALLAM